jgi:hypothetical protein
MRAEKKPEATMNQLMRNAAVLAPVVCSLFACGSSSSGTTDGGSMEPTISISAPTAGSMVTVTMPGDTFPVTFSTTNFMLAAAGTCSQNLKTTDNCGHVHVFVDNDACTPDGASYDNQAAASPATAILSTCPMANGTHTVRLELHRDNHAAIQVNGATVSASVMITATGG